jgi:hypothetical protein
MKHTSEMDSFLKNLPMTMKVNGPISEMGFKGFGLIRNRLLRIAPAKTCLWHAITVFLKKKLIAIWLDSPHRCHDKCNQNVTGMTQNSFRFEW